MFVVPDCDAPNVMADRQPLSFLQAVQSVNMTHDTAHAQMDVKLRSLICCGLKSV